MLAGMLEGTADEDELVAAVADRAHFENAAELVGDVTDRDVEMSRVPWNFGGGPVLFRRLHVHLGMWV
jgi:hypothetical protein